MAVVFTGVWTPSGGAAATLFDITQGYGVVLDNPGDAAAVEQVDELAFASYVSRIMRGNVKGELVFTAAKSFSTLAAAATDFKTKLALVGGKGTMVITINTTVLTYANATFRALAPVKIEGVRWPLRYSFGITQIT